MKKNEFFLDIFSKNFSKKLTCSIMLLCHEDISLESKTVIRPQSSPTLFGLKFLNAFQKFALYRASSVGA